MNKIEPDIDNIEPEIEGETPAAELEPGNTRRAWVRPGLLIAGPLLVVVAGAYVYLTGGRYVSTDNAYVHADMVAISPQVSGPIKAVLVNENQHVDKGDLLFRIDRSSYDIAVSQAKANLAAIRQDVNALKQTYQQQRDNLQLAKINLEYAERRYKRQSSLQKSRVVSQATLDEAANALDTARQQVVVAKQAMQTTLANLNGSADTPVEQTPQFRKAKAAFDEAVLNLAHTDVKAPFAGIASNTPKPGKYVAPGSAVMALVSDRDLWIDANFKEIDVTNIGPGQAVDITVDAYPGEAWHGTVASLAPATGAEFSVLPAQNATGNWVKVVQRIPVRIAVDNKPKGSQLRAGMSTSVEIDTRHKRELPAFARRIGEWLGSYTGNALAHPPIRQSPADR